MQRCDYDLPYLLTYENIAWYDEGIVKILDRRIYPIKKVKVECKSHVEVAKAITDMVTQSAGPYTAVGMGMALAAYESRDFIQDKRIEYLEKASFTLANARPTTANRMGMITKDCYEVGKQAILRGENPIEAIVTATIESLNRRYSMIEKVGEHLINQIPDSSAILTQCYGETIIAMICRLNKQKNKNLRFFCAETRPFLQGARLTASCFAESGFDTTVVTDNMIAWLLESGQVSVFTSAADTIARSGHVANKIGTYQIAILCKHFNIPFYVTGLPDVDKMGKDDIIIEMRDPASVTEFMGIRFVDENVKSVYPSFDITPPKLINGIVTDRGIYKPELVNEYFDGNEKKFY